MEKIAITQAGKEDLQTILDLQYCAYQSEAALFGSQDIPPLKQTIEEVQEEYKRGVILKMEAAGTIIGSVRAVREGDTVYVGKLMVHPDYRRQGFGKRLLQEVEVLFPGCRYELFTSSLSENNLRLYGSVGYTEFKRERVNEMLTFVYLEKNSKR